MPQGIDVIGDVHGHADTLEDLLSSLGYAERAGAWRHPSRSAFFLGDLVDRGPDQLRTISIVRDMMEAGSARCIMGNHELNAIAWAMRGDDGSFLRPHTEHNRGQHSVFLDAVGEGSELHRETIRFFLELPLFVETEDAAFVHACWNRRAVDMLRSSRAVDADGRLDFMQLEETLRRRKAPALFEAVETLLKGPEIDLPHGRSFVDTNGIVRRRTRLLWWNTGDRYGDLCPTADVTAAGCEADKIPSHGMEACEDEVPVFFGHYWMRGEPALVAPTRACLDFSVAKDGVLCAYRFDGEAILDPENLVWVAPGPRATIEGFLP
jgi:hypothetical protein